MRCATSWWGTRLRIRWSGFLNNFLATWQVVSLLCSCFLNCGLALGSVPTWCFAVPKFCKSNHFSQMLTPQKTLSTHFSRTSPKWSFVKVYCSSFRKGSSRRHESQSTWFLKLLNRIFTSFSWEWFLGEWNNVTGQR